MKCFWNFEMWLKMLFSSPRHQPRVQKLTTTHANSLSHSLLQSNVNLFTIILSFGRQKVKMLVLSFSGKSWPMTKKPGCYHKLFYAASKHLRHEGLNKIYLQRDIIFKKYVCFHKIPIAPKIFFWPPTCVGNFMLFFKMFRFDTPTPSESAMTFQGVGMVIFWNCTMCPLQFSS